MDASGSVPSTEVRKTTLLVVAGFFAIGFILFLLALAVLDGFWKEFTRELSIVLFTVFGVSMIYEIFVAERHFSSFSRSLHRMIERGETNAAVCERLGIFRIFQSREEYLRQYSLAQVASAATMGSPFRMIGTTLFQAMTRSEAIREALRNGANVELCFLDPGSGSSAFRTVTRLQSSDTVSSLGRFKTELAGWITQERPKGRLEIRHHQIDLFDSYFAFALGGERVAVWDLNFGADPAAKRVILVNSEKGLGADLGRRYGSIWEKAARKFEYGSGKVVLDELLLP